MLKLHSQQKQPENNPTANLLQTFKMNFIQFICNRYHPLIKQVITFLVFADQKYGYPSGIKSVKNTDWIPLALNSQLPHM